MDQAEFEQHLQRIKDATAASLDANRQMLENHLHFSGVIHDREASRALVRSAEAILARPPEEVPQA